MKSKIASEAIIRRDERFDGENVYSYELTMKEGSSVASFKIPLYTITVRLTSAKGSSTEASAQDAFSDASKAISFYERMVANFATPIDLIYVLEDEVTR